jgi:polynucleotide 5'-kinase involved in rRNA processing
MNDTILTNTDYKGVEIVKSYYLNTPTPNLNISYYNRCVEALLKHFRTQVPSSLDKEKVLIINTCGWVEGLGAEIQLKIAEIVSPQIVVTMTKHQ